MKKIIALALAIIPHAHASIAEFVIKNELEARATHEAQEYQRLMAELVECDEKEKNLHTNIEILRASNMAHKEFILSRAARMRTTLHSKCRNKNFLMPLTEAESLAQTFAQELVKTLQN